MKAKKIVVVQKFHGLPKESDFKSEEEEIPDLQDGEYLCEAEYISVDPYLRFQNDVGKVIPGGQVAKVLKSRNTKFPEGSYIVGYLGWRTLSVANNKSKVTPLPKEITGDLSHSLGLGVLGMPGMTAYFGFLECCQPKVGDVVLVSTAAGATGSLVGQIAKIKGCRVIAFTGTDEKVKWLKEELGFDHVFNYKKVDPELEIKKVAPEGIDCYFDNIGGEFSSKVLWQMKEFGRIAVCGAISLYNELEHKVALAPCVQIPMITKQLSMRGFLVNQWEGEFHKGHVEMSQWIRQGKLKYKETITSGFENIPKAFISMLKGENIGKAVVKV